MTPCDQLWVDMTQFDTEVADGVWDGTTVDPDAPSWYRDLRSVIHRARGPAEPHELVDEPVTVPAMHRTARGRTLARIPRSGGVRALGRVVAVKAAAATTASVVGVAAAAAATTGIVATVAASVVVPAVAEHVVPVIGEHLAPIEMATPDESGASAAHETAGPAPSVVAGAADAGVPTLEVRLAVTPDPEPAPEPVEPAPAPDPVPEEVPAEPAPVGPAPVDPAPSDVGTVGETRVAAEPEAPAPRNPDEPEAHKPADPEAPAEPHKPAAPAAPAEPAKPGHPEQPDHPDPAEPGSPWAGARRTTPMG